MLDTENEWAILLWKYPEEWGQRLPSRCWTHAMEGAPFRCPCNLSYSVRSLGQFNILSFVLSMLQNTSKSDFNVRFFPLCHFLWNFFILSSPSLMSVSLASSVPPAASVESWTVAVWTFPQSASNSLTPLRSVAIPRPALPLFNSLWKFHLCWPIPSFDYPRL